MKTRRLILFIISSLLLLQNLQSQSFLFKVGGKLGLITGTNLVIDSGIELQFRKHLGVQFSYTNIFYESESGYSFQILSTPQLRFYHRNNEWLQPYCGLILQKHYMDSDLSQYNGNGLGVNFTKYGVGIIVGQHLKVYKSIGFDFHLGFLREKGDVRTTKYFRDNTTSSKTNTTEKGKLTERLFWGINLYFNVGKQNNSKKKK